MATGRVMQQGGIAGKQWSEAPASSRGTSAATAAPWWEGAGFAQFDKNFAVAERRQLMHDDVEAWRVVSIMLTSVVVAGMLAMALTVLYTLL